MLKNIFEWIIGLALIAGVMFIGGEVITYVVCNSVADSYVELCEDKINLPIDADIAVERTGFMRYSYTIHSNNLAGVICNKHSDTVSMNDMIMTVLED